MTTKIIVFGHHQKLKLITITPSQRESIHGDGLIINGHAPEIWQSDCSGDVIEGILDNLIVGVDDEEYSIEIPDEAPITAVIRDKTYLVWYETQKIWYEGSLKGDFDINKISLDIKKYDFDEDSEPYIFGHVMYPGVEFNELENSSVDAGFFLVDEQEGILRIELEEGSNSFKIAAY